MKNKMLMIGTKLKMQIPNMGLREVSYAGHQEQGDFYTFQDNKQKKVILIRPGGSTYTDDLVILKEGHEGDLNILTNESLSQLPGEEKSRLVDSLKIMGLELLVQANTDIEIKGTRE